MTAREGDDDGDCVTEGLVVTDFEAVGTAAEQAVRETARLSITATRVVIARFNFGVLSVARVTVTVVSPSAALR